MKCDKFTDEIQTVTGCKIIYFEHTNRNNINLKVKDVKISV